MPRSRAEAYTLKLRQPFGNAALLRLLALVALFHLLGAGACWQARQTNKLWMRSSSKLEIASPPPPDAGLRSRTIEYLEHPCEIAHLACEEGEVTESETVHALHDGSSSRAVRKLFDQKYQYSSAYHLIKELAVRGSDRDVVALTRLPVFSGDWEAVSLLLKFARDWYLVPALEHATRRERDAVEKLETFEQLAGNAFLQDDYWLSAEGLDLTDLPVLSSTFCRQRDALRRDRCRLGLLKAVGRSLLLASGPDDPEAGHFTVEQAAASFWDEGIEIGPVYRKLPPELQDPLLGGYLDALEQLARDQPEAAHRLLAPGAPDRPPEVEHLWRYLQARTELALAAKEEDATACARWVRRARASLAASLRASRGAGGLERVVASRLAELAEEEPCS